jgi:hypothetical protein
MLDRVEKSHMQELISRCVYYVVGHHEDHSFVVSGTTERVLGMLSIILCLFSGREAEFDYKARR